MMKKTLTRLLAVLLILVLTFAFAACGESNVKRHKKNKKHDEKEPAFSETVDEEVDEDENTDSDEFSAGTVSGDTYTNDFLGLSFELPDGWTYKTDEEIAEQVNNGLEMVKDGEALKKGAAQSIYGFMAADSSNTSQAMLYFVKGYGADTASMDTMMNEMLKAGAQQYESMGWTVTWDDISSSTLGSCAFEKSIMSIDLGNGVTMKQGWYLTARDDYYGIVSLLSVTDSIDDLEDQFS